MALRAATCQNCGGNLQIDDQREKGFCPFCGTEYYTEKIINQTFVTNNYSGATIHVHSADIESIVGLTESFCEQGNYDGALRQIDTALPNAPKDPRLWHLRMKAQLIQRVKTEEPTFEDILYSFQTAVENAYPSNSQLIGQIFRDVIEGLYKCHLWYVDRIRVVYQDTEIKMTDSEKEQQEKQATREPWITKHTQCVLTLIDILEHKAIPFAEIDNFLRIDLQKCAEEDRVLEDWRNTKGKKQDSISQILPQYSLLNSGGVMHSFQPVLRIKPSNISPKSLNYETYNGKLCINTPEGAKIKSKKGKRKEPTYFGTILLYIIREAHPDYQSSTLNEAERLMLRKDSGGCYIATCVYGSYDCPQVWTLRRYRDETMAESWIGRFLLKPITRSARHLLNGSEAG